MGKALRRDGRDGGGRRRAIPRLLTLALALAATPVAVRAQDAPLELERGRFTVAHFPRDARLAGSLLENAVARDTFPGLPRPTARVRIAIAPDDARFREWSGPGAPEWGAAIAVPEEQRVVLQGQRAGSDAGDPLQVLRHELAHLALHEALGDLPPRWFDEGYASYAAGEWGREQVFETSVALLFRGMPPLDSLDDGFLGGAGRATAAYALAHRAVAELAEIDRARGLALFFQYWKETGSMERAMRSAFGLTKAGFEQRWRSNTRRRYGALALFADLSLAAGLVVFVVLPLYLARRQRDRRRLAALIAADEAAERVGRESAIEELLRSIPPAGPPAGPSAPPSTPPAPPPERP